MSLLMEDSARVARMHEVVAVVLQAEAAGRPYRFAELARAHGYDPVQFCSSAGQARRAGHFGGELVHHLNTPPKLGKRRRKGKRMPCMRCHSEFTSQGPHNRMCGSCRSESVGPFEGEYAVHRAPAYHGPVP